MRISLSFLITLVMVCSSEASCLKGNCRNGSGTYQYKDGSRYHGNFLKNLPHGYGTMTYRDGTEYTGYFAYGKKEGEGIIKYNSGNYFKGNFKNGNISGLGTMNFASGDTYSGQWVENTMHGSGSYHAADGWMYSGNFTRGKPDGYGSLSLADGSLYTGYWCEGLKNGDFEYKDPKGSIQKIRFRDDMYMGPVNVTSQAGIVSGSLHKHKNNANEVVTETAPVSKTKVKNCNDFFCDAETGYMVMDNGAVYYGEFKNGLPDGRGKTRYKDGMIVEGIWKAGKVINTYKADKINQDTGPSHTVRIQNESYSTTPIKISKNNNSNYLKDEKQTPRIHALIAGVSSYKALNSLRYTDDDAYRFYAFLKSPEGGALQDESIRLMIDESATSANILNNLHSIAGIAGPEDALIVYLSGHGLDGGFVPHDFDGSGPILLYDKMIEAIRKSKAKHKLIIADACHSGSLAHGVRSAAMTSIQKYYNSLSESAGGIAFLVSSALDEVSLEYGGIRQGIFSHFLIRGLKGEADMDANKVVSLEELYHYISANVSSYTGGKQNPILSGKYDAKMPVASVRN